tara:strand:+ start:986 stop:1591 length:606 start_codon:yes stop_codon:yes gene_type:complete
MEELLLPILTAMIGVGGTLLTLWYKHKLDRLKLEDKACPVSECITEDTAILERMREVLANTNADRLCIFSFHNGGYYYSGKSMQKMSMSYEQVDNGVSSIQLDKQNIPVSACMTTLQPLMENGEFHNADTKLYPDGLCKYHLLQDGVKSTYYWPIIDIYNKAIGMLRLDYVKRKTKITIEDQELLELLASQLPGYLVMDKK